MIIDTQKKQKAEFLNVGLRTIIRIALRKNTENNMND